MQIAIVQFPGSNCERETILAVKRAKMQPIEFLWNEQKEKLMACDGCIIVGGFSYEDRCRAGAIAALDPVVQTLHKLNEQDKPILGICNGAQILVESGIVPGLINNQVGMALATNKRIKDNQVQGTGFYNAWINLKKLGNSNDAFTKYFNGPINIPTAHAEGRFIIPEKLFNELKQKNIGMLQYCDKHGQINEEFPINPNGSQYNLAAICNANGNAMAIMPHPERTTNGDLIFNSMHDYIKQSSYSLNKKIGLEFNQIKTTPKIYTPPPNTLEIVTELIITDNAAISVQKAINNLGIKCKIRRKTHWEILLNAKTELIKSELIKSQELFNSRKELISKQNNSKSISFLVQDKEDLIGRKKLETLQHYKEFSEITKITKGIIWEITGENREEISKIITEKQILFNPFAHNPFIYLGEKK